MPDTLPKLTQAQHEACARRLALLEGWTQRTWRELAAVYGEGSLAARAAEAAVGALANLRDAAQHQARQDWPHDRTAAAHYQPPKWAAGGG
jgi:hypothetical protein